MIIEANLGIRDPKQVLQRLVNHMRGWGDKATSTRAQPINEFSPPTLFCLGIWPNIFNLNTQRTAIWIFFCPHPPLYSTILLLHLQQTPPLNLNLILSSLPSSNPSLQSESSAEPVCRLIIKPCSSQGPRCCVSYWFWCAF